MAGCFEFCCLLLMKDNNYHWFIRVPQLHIHHIVRLSAMTAWPAPVGGQDGRPCLYSEGERWLSAKRNTLLTAGIDFAR